MAKSGKMKKPDTRPARKRYNSEKRWIKNKERRIETQENKELKKQLKLAKRKKEGKP